MTSDPKDAERLVDRLLDEIRLGIAAQFDESRIQCEDVIEEHSLVLSIEEQLRHSGLLDEIGRLTQERDEARRKWDALKQDLDDCGVGLHEAIKARDVGHRSAEALRKEIHACCPHEGCQDGMLYFSDGKTAGACEWKGHVLGGFT